MKRKQKPPTKQELIDAINRLTDELKRRPQIIVSPPQQIVIKLPPNDGPQPGPMVPVYPHPWDPSSYPVWAGRVVPTTGTSIACPVDQGIK